MCDYNLYLIASRPARVGDKLVSTRFRNSLTRGFAATGEPDVAVCLLPGTEVAFERDVECDGAFRFFRSRSLKQKVARFWQVNLDQPTTHHDALEFPDGEIVLLTELREGQHVAVLQLPASARTPTEAAPARAGSDSAQQIGYESCDHRRDAQADHRARLNDMAMRRSFGRAGWLHGQDASPGTRSMSTGADIESAPF
jgi:hypothetical protein